MSRDDDLPQTFREVGIYLRDIKDDIVSTREEMDQIKKGQSRLMGIIFTSLIAPIIVGIVVAYVIATSR